ncbi:histidine phosphatase family protein [Sulfitobacter alexandrii]|uniref:Histidine phosphatase family protein n=1 Tax=Sulfitobacter alexandrii TaxID=1917485 RepID=A0A1J0WKD9_9RHOB|nr:histidine phosphatase family protein [Sulfitobacter alexandrii]APE44733.1 histidine phosphatase family protein [Sulfitobacter alexandrii]
MTTWHWVRHGPTHEKTFVGWRDVPADLSDAARLARLTGFLPDTALIVSSDLSRSITTADALEAPRRHRLPHRHDLRELHFGDWDGKHFTEIERTHPELSRTYWESPGDVAAPGGESWNEAAARVSAAVDALNSRHPDAHIIAVAHFGVILTQVQRALGVSATEAMAHKIDNLSVTELHHRAGTWQVQRINHLP